MLKFEERAASKLACSSLAAVDDPSVFAVRVDRRDRLEPDFLENRVIPVKLPKLSPKPLPEPRIERWMQRVAKLRGAEIPDVDCRLQVDVDQLGAPTDRKLAATRRQVVLRSAAKRIRCALVPSVELPGVDFSPLGVEHLGELNAIQKPIDRFPCLDRTRPHVDRCSGRPSRVLEEDPASRMNARLHLTSSRRSEIPLMTCSVSSVADLRSTPGAALARRLRTSIVGDRTSRPSPRCYRFPTRKR